MKKKATVLLADGFEELEAMGPIDLLTRAGVDVDLVSVENKDKVTGRNGVAYSPVVPLEGYVFDSDALILPGGAGFKTLENNPKVIEEVKKYAADDEKILAAICAAPTILGRLGLLKDKKYTCFTSMTEDFGGNYLGTYAVTDGKLITGKSAAAAIDFGLALAEGLLGTEAARELGESIYY